MTACKSNLRNIATACEMYSSDNQGFYPSTLSKLQPNYLKVIPACAVAGKETYSDSYVCSAQIPTAYTVLCQGNYHESVGITPNYPQYSSFNGLLLP